MRAEGRGWAQVGGGLPTPAHSSDSYKSHLPQATSLESPMGGGREKGIPLLREVRGESSLTSLKPAPAAGIGGGRLRGDLVPRQGEALRSLWAPGASAHPGGPPVFQRPPAQPRRRRAGRSCQAGGGALPGEGKPTGQGRCGEQPPRKLREGPSRRGVDSRAGRGRPSPAPPPLLSRAPRTARERGRPAPQPPASPPPGHPAAPRALPNHPHPPPPLTFTTLGKASKKAKEKKKKSPAPPKVARRRAPAAAAAAPPAAPLSRSVARLAMPKGAAGRRTDAVQPLPDSAHLRSRRWRAARSAPRRGSSGWRAALVLPPAPRLK